MVKLWHDHTHAGVKYRAGQVVELPDEAADWAEEAELRLRERTRRLAAQIPGTPERRKAAT